MDDVVGTGVDRSGDGVEAVLADHHKDAAPCARQASKVTGELFRAERADRRFVDDDDMQLLLLGKCHDAFAFVQTTDTKVEVE